MFLFENCARTIRNLPFLRRMNYFWVLLTPIYEHSLRIFYNNELKRVINKTDVIYIPHNLRHLTDKYESEVWDKIMKQVQEGDIIADVGACYGFYAFAFANRTGRTGRVFAFEPDPGNLYFIRNIVRRYRISAKLDIIPCAVGETKGMLKFNALGVSTSSVASVHNSNAKQRMEEVQCITLDEFFAGEKLDILKIDVEGYEEKVLLGARNILNRKSGYPRVIIIQVLPL